MILYVVAISIFALYLGDGRARSGRDSGRSWSERPNRLASLSAAGALKQMGMDGGFSNGTAPLSRKAGKPRHLAFVVLSNDERQRRWSAVAPHLDAFARAPSWKHARPCDAPICGTTANLAD